MDEILKKKINFEISQLDEHISKSSLLVKKCALKEPDYIELCAIGSIIQSYYNGIENILLLISKSIDGTVPNQGKWHSELLSSLCLSNEKRPAVFSENLKTILFDYMNFRHFFHSYGYSIQWDKAKHLFLGIEDNWNSVKSELNVFIQKLDEAK